MMKADHVKKQIADLPPQMLGYLAGLLSVHLGISRTIKALDAINAIPDAGSDPTKYFANLICLMAIETREIDWDRTVEVLKKVMAS